MVISYRAAYTLLDNHYIRRSLQGYINDYVGEPIFNASLVMAHKLEDYQYLQVMVNERDAISNKYMIFVRDGSVPLFLEKEKDFTPREFAILCSKTCIHKEHLRSCIHDVAFGQGLDVTIEIETFEKMYDEYKR